MEGTSRRERPRKHSPDKRVMCLLIPGTAGTLFAATPIWSARSTGATPREWPVHISGMQAALVIDTVPRRRRVFRVTSRRAHQDTVRESRQDMQLPDMQHQDTQFRERCISPALPPDIPGTAHARALRALPAGQTQPRQPQPHHRLLLQHPRSVMHAGKR